MADRGQRKVREGTVVSAAMNKTAVVVLKRQLPHATYGKYVTKSKKYYVHDEENQCHRGDTVRFMETRPLSKLKRWRLIEILERAKIE
jgi:small subunit ribosomal protein S17